MNLQITYTASYSAPELYKGKYPSPAYDVFSLGVTILKKLPINKNSLMAEYPGKVIRGFREEAEGSHFDQDYSRKKVSQDIAASFQGYQLFGTLEESKFIGKLLQDCLAFEPKDRISAAQLAEILQVFSTYLENPSSGCPKYEDVKNMAIEDCPKGIPIALRKMLFDSKTQSQAVDAIKALVEVDPSYKSTPSYGMILLLNEQGFGGKIRRAISSETFKSWAKDNPEAFQQLKDRTYIFGNEHKPGQDMPVSKKIYRQIQSLS